MMGKCWASPSRNPTANSVAAKTVATARNRTILQPTLSELPCASFMVNIPTIIKSISAQMPKPPSVMSFSTPSPV